MSNTIYSAILPVISQDKNKFNFVYQITEISTGIKYIGSHGTEKSDPLKALKKYKSTTKNKCFKLSQKLNPLNYYYEILSYHSTRNFATLEESRLHFLYDVKCNPKYYNKSNQTANGFSVAGYVTVKDKHGNTSSVPIDDPRYLSGELVSINKGMVIVCDNNTGAILRVSTDDHRYISGLLSSISSGRVRAYYPNNIDVTFMVSINDPRLKTGELYVWSKNRINVKSDNGTISNIISYDGWKNNYTHINKNKVAVTNKNGNYIQVDKDDPLYLSGELVGINKGKVVVQDKNGNYIRVSVDDPEYLTGNLKHNTAGKAVFKNIHTGEIVQFSVNDPLIKTGDYIGIACGRKKCFNIKENKFVYAYLNDPRLATGELIKCDLKKYSKVTIKSTPSGKKWCNNGISEMLVININEYLNNGWTKGRLNRKK